MSSLRTHLNGAMAFVKGAPVALGVLCYTTAPRHSECCIIRLWHAHDTSMELRDGGTSSFLSSFATGYVSSSNEWVYRKYATLDTSRSRILKALSALPERIGGQE